MTGASRSLTKRHVRQKGLRPLFRSALEKRVRAPFPVPRRTTDMRPPSQPRTAESPARPNSAADSRADIPRRRGPGRARCRRRERTARRSRASLPARGSARRHAQLPQSAQTQQRRSRIAAAAAQARLHRNLLLQRHHRIARLAAAARRFPQQLRGFPHEIRAVGRHAWHIAANFERAAPRFARHAIEQVDGLQNRLNVVESVRAPAGDAQRQVDLGERAKSDGCHAQRPSYWPSGPALRSSSSDSGATPSGIFNATSWSRGKIAVHLDLVQGQREVQILRRAAQPATGDRPETPGSRSRVRRNVRRQFATRVSMRRR